MHELPYADIGVTVKVSYKILIQPPGFEGKEIIWLDNTIPKPWHPINMDTAPRDNGNSAERQERTSGLCPSRAFA